MSFADAAQQNLRWLLRPIEALLADPALTDMHINSVGEGQCFVDRGRGAERITLPYSFRDLEDIAVNAATFTSQDRGADEPSESARRSGNELPGQLPCADRPAACGRRWPHGLLDTPAKGADLDAAGAGAGRRLYPDERRPEEKRSAAGPIA